MRYVLTLISLLILSACSGYHRTELTIRGFEKYVKLFEDYSSEYGKPIKVTNLIIKLDNLDAPKNGNCRLFLDGRTPEITFDTEYWEWASELKREILALHEESHCINFKEHRKDLLIDNCPASIMYPYTLSENCYKIHKKEYLKELFNDKI